jgi:membrane associated rhomboid family serine protease
MASFGGALARRIGAGRFLGLGVVAAAAGAGFHYLLHADDEGLVIGASGAVSGMMAATARFAFAPGGPLAEGRPQQAYSVARTSLIGLVGNSRAMAFLLVWFGLNILLGFGSAFIPGVGGPIAWEAHIGGFLVGLLLFPLFDPAGDRDSSGGRLA